MTDGDVGRRREHTGEGGTPFRDHDCEQKMSGVLPPTLPLSERLGVWVFLQGGPAGSCTSSPPVGMKAGRGPAIKKEARRLKIGTVCRDTGPRDTGTKNGALCKLPANYRQITGKFQQPLRGVASLRGGASDDAHDKKGIADNTEHWSMGHRARITGHGSRSTAHEITDLVFRSEKVRFFLFLEPKTEVFGDKRRFFL